MSCVCFLARDSFRFYSTALSIYPKKYIEKRAFCIQAISKKQQQQQQHQFTYRVSNHRNQNTQPKNKNKQQRKKNVKRNERKKERILKIVQFSQRASKRSDVFHYQQQYKKKINISSKGERKKKFNCVLSVVPCITTTNSFYSLIIRSAHIEQCGVVYMWEIRIKSGWREW